MPKSAVLRWEEPPPSVYAPAPERRESRYGAIAEELRSRPGEWGVVYEGSKRLAAALSTHIRTGGVTAFAPGGHFDACARVRGDRRTVYARFLGDGEG